REYARVVGQENDVVGEIITLLRARNTRCQPVMLKNAETITRVWPKREKYIIDTNAVPYGKLRDALTILDPDFVAQHKVSQKDLTEIIKCLSTLTFEKFRAYVKRIRSKYDPLGESVDFDEMFDDIYEATTQLKELVESKNSYALDGFRAKFEQSYIENTRKIISSMKSEEMLGKLRSNIINKRETVLNSESDKLETYIVRVTQNLLLLYASSESRR